MTFELSLVSALLLGATPVLGATHDCGCGGERPAAAPDGPASTPSVETVPVSTTSLATTRLVCPRLLVQAYPGYYVWNCRRHAPATGGGYRCDVWDDFMVVHSGQEYGECVDGDGTGGCFEMTSAFAASAAGPDSMSPPPFRLRREAPADSSYTAFELPREENVHIVEWPEEDSTPGTVVRVDLPDGTPFCYLKLFDLRLKVDRAGLAGDPYDMARIGVEVAKPAGEPEVVVPVGVLEAATDAASGRAFDGLYRMRHADERYFVRMMRMLPDET